MRIAANTKVLLAGLGIALAITGISFILPPAEHVPSPAEEILAINNSIQELNDRLDRFEFSMREAPPLALESYCQSLAPDNCMLSVFCYLADANTCEVVAPGASDAD